MAHKDGEASVEDILRSIKQVISREDGPRAPTPRGEDGAPGSERPGGFSPTPYSFTRHSPFGSRVPDVTSSFVEDKEPKEEAEAEGRTDVFDLKSLDSDALELDESDVEPGAEQDSASEPDEVRMIVPPVLPPLAEDEGAEPAPAANPYGSAFSGEDEAVSETEDGAVPLAAAEPVEDEDTTPSITLEPPYGAEPLPEAEPAAALPEAEAEPEPVTEVEAEPVDLSEAEPLAAMPGAEDEVEEENAATPAADDSESLIAGAAAATLRDSFAALQSVASTPEPSKPAGTANPLEDMVREMMRPMLKQWLDDNMPGMVEKIVEREIARITGRL